MARDGTSKILRYLGTTQNKSRITRKFKSSNTEKLLVVDKILNDVEGVHGLESNDYVIVCKIYKVRNMHKVYNKKFDVSPLMY